MSGEEREAMQAMEQTCTLDVESASLRLQHTLSLSLSLSLKEIKSTSSVIWTQGRAKARRQSDWQPGFDFIVTTEEDDIHYVPVLCTSRGELGLSNILPEEGCEIKDAATSHLGRLPMLQTSVPD